MPGSTPKLSKDRESIVLKFDELIKRAKKACEEFQASSDRTIRGDTYYELRVSAINLLARLTSDETIYVQELRNMNPNAFAIKGVLQAAREDYLQGFMADHRLLISAEIFDDLLVQAEVLLEYDYKDAAAVLVRAVLEDGLRKLCRANDVPVERRDTIQQLNEKLHRHGVSGYSLLHHKEIVAKAEIGNCAAHARFDSYTKQDVEAFLEYVRRFLGQFLVP